MKNNFELKYAKCCYDCLHHVTINYCGCHCHDNDACSKYLKIIGSSGAAGGYICDSFEDRNEFSDLDITGKEADMMGYTYYNFKGDN